MDYCSSCRRHLNGALVCPGCGAYAPDIDPAAYAHADRTPVAMMSAGLQATTQYGDFDTWEDATPDTAPDHAPAGEPDVLASQPLTEGRAARRRQRARWKKNQRRAVVATAVALVSGSVAMVAMDQQPSDRARAAAAPEEPGADLAGELAGQYGSPAVKRSDESRSTPASSSAAERSGRHAGAGSVRTAPSDSRTEMAAPPREAQASVTRQRTTTPTSGQAGSGSTGTSGVPDVVQQPVTTPTTPSSPPPSTGESTPTQPPAAQDPSAPPEPQDPRLCLLVVCLG